MGESNEEADVYKRSSFSGGGNCVEVLLIDGGGAFVRSSRTADAPPMTFTRAEWQAFVDGVKAGEFDPA